MFGGLGQDEIEFWWEYLKPLIEKGLKREPGKYDIENIYDSLKKGTTQIWAGFSNTSYFIEIIAITKILEFTEKKVLFIEMVAGKNLYKWMENLAIIKQWGTDNGCQSLEFSARKGFRKYLRQMNFREKMICYEGPL